MIIIISHGIGRHGNIGYILISSIYISVSLASTHQVSWATLSSPTNLKNELHHLKDFTWFWNFKFIMHCFLFQKHPDCTLIGFWAIKPQLESLQNSLFIPLIWNLLYYISTCECVFFVFLPFGQVIMTLGTKGHSFLFAHDKYWLFIHHNACIE